MKAKGQAAVIIAYLEKLNLEGRLHLYAQAAISAGAILICADSGGEAALAWGLKPDFLVGDMDSISPATRAALEAMPGVELRVVPVEKDETDLELALYTALEIGASDITIVGGLGGRLDHTLGNLYLLAAPRLTESAARVRVLGEQEEVFLLRGGEKIELQGEPAELLSLIPISSAATGVRTEGLYYPLKSETLWLGPTRGISNVFIGSTATVAFDEGLLLVIHTFK